MSNYIALLRKSRSSDYSVEFPDLPGCVTAGKTLDEARALASEALALHLRGIAEDSDVVPAPSSLDAIMTDPDHGDAVAFLVEAPARKSRSVPVTITITEDLQEIVRGKAAEFGMSQSGLFAASVRHYLGLAPAGRVLRTGRRSKTAPAKKPAKNRKIASAKSKRA